MKQMTIYDVPLNKLLADEQVYGIFEGCFSKNPWLNLTALVDSESTVEIMHRDGSLPDDVLGDIEEALKNVTFNPDDFTDESVEKLESAYA